MKKFNEVKNIIASIEADVEKFVKSNNNAAGTRVRKAMQEVKNLTQDIRKEVIVMKEKIKAEPKKD